MYRFFLFQERKADFINQTCQQAKGMVSDAKRDAKGMVSDGYKKNKKFSKQYADRNEGVENFNLKCT